MGKVSSQISLKGSAVKEASKGRNLTVLEQCTHEMHCGEDCSGGWGMN